MHGAAYDAVVAGDGDDGGVVDGGGGVNLWSDADALKVANAPVGSGRRLNAATDRLRWLLSLGWDWKSLIQCWLGRRSSQLGRLAADWWAASQVSAYLLARGSHCPRYCTPSTN